MATLHICDLGRDVRTFCAGHAFNRPRSLHLRKAQMGGKRITVVPGQCYGRLTIVSEITSCRQPCGKLKRRIACNCECGNTTIVELGSLRNGHVQSCGCLQREVVARIGAASTTHGLSTSPTYRIWNAMKQRCANPNDSYYHLYGAIGVVVCERWQNSFQAFVDDMGERPSTNHSIDRYPDRNGPYSPDNCRWATARQQQRNRRNNIVLTIGDESKCVAEWAEHVGVRVGMIWDRLRSGWCPEDAVMVPKDGSRRS